MRKDIVKQAKEKQAVIDTASAMLTDEQAATVPSLYREWAIGEAVVAGDRRYYSPTEKLYKALQNHTTQADWSPDVTPALWVEVAPAGEYREIKDNMLSTEAFALNEVGWYQTKDNLYKSLMNANVYTPVTYPAGWEKVE